jgi:pyrroline-5-carboxylate reductase
VPVSYESSGQETPVKAARRQAASPNAVVFLGGGRITGALLAGLHRSEYNKPIIVHDRHVAKLRRLRRQYGVAVEPSLSRALEQARLLVIAVRPDSVREVLQQMTGVHTVLAVSLAAGIPLAKLRRWAPPPLFWARAMPSPLARFSRGLTALTFDRNFPSAARREVRSFFSRVGTVLEVPESRFDAFTVTYSSSHGYHALAALAGAAQKLGLDRKTALTAAAHALADGILAWREGKVALDDLLREAATPGGIAAATMAGMDKSGYKQIVRRGLQAGMRRARRSSKARQSGK